MQKKAKKVINEYPKMVETFMPINDWEISRMRQEQPSAFNSMVRVERFRVTVEKIEEPIEVIQARLEKLWVDSDNHHYYNPLKDMALKLGYTFKGQFGENRKQKAHKQK